MKSALKRFWGFPYPDKYEEGYNRDLTKKMHKPLLIAVTATLLIVTWLVGICIFWPNAIAPAEYLDGILIIHFTFMVFTIITLFIAIIFRREWFKYPKFYLCFVNSYAIAICIWASVLSAYAYYSVAIYTAFIFVMLCVAMVSLFKPWLAIINYLANYILYFSLYNHFIPVIDRNALIQYFSAALAVLTGIIIATAFYRFRARTYYDNIIIAEQLEKINQINSQLQKLIHIDNLTGLLNRRFYEEILPKEMESINQTSSFCCMMLDIDFFKLYNDCYGHPAGDECLRTVSMLVKDSVPEDEGFVIRYGGEEFFILTRVESIKDARLLADSICSSVENAYIPHAESPLHKVTISCGLVYCDKSESHHLRSITKRADDALYKSKQNGRNQVTLG